MTATAYWRSIVRAARTGVDVLVASVVHTVISGFVEIEAWYIVPIAGLIAAIFKALREKHPDAWVWRYLPL